MYEAPSASPTTTRPAVRRSERVLPPLPPRKPGTPLQDVQLEALRSELEVQNWLDDLMSVMKAAGNDTRVRILYLLWRRGEVRVNDLASILELTTPAISQQLKKLRACHLVHARRDAQTIYYRLNTDAEFIKCLIGFFTDESR